MYYTYGEGASAATVTNQTKGMTVEGLMEREEKMKHTAGTGGHDSRDDDRNALGNHNGGEPTGGMCSTNQNDAVFIQSEFL